MKERHLYKKLSVCVCATLTGFVLSGGTPVWAADPAAQVLRKAYETKTSTQPVSRYDVGKKNEAFILDQRRQGVLLFRYVRSREVFVLRQVAGPRGDTMLKNDLGAVMVRMSRVGGPVLFPERASHGIPAWRSGPAAPLGPQTVQLADLRPTLKTIANDLVMILDHDVTISIRGANEQSAWLFLDTALNARSALNRIARNPDRKGRTLPELNQIRLVAAEQQELRLEDAILEIHLVTQEGFAGRPSSLRLAGFLSGKRVHADKN
jgi:Domain of unknown function (DUF4908)